MNSWSSNRLMLELQTFHLQISSGWHYGNWATGVFLLQGERWIRPIPIAYFFMLSTKSFIQTAIISSLTCSTGRFGGSSEKKECLFSNISPLLCLNKTKRDRCQSFQKVMEGHGRTSEHARWMHFKTLQLNYRYFAKVGFKKWQAHSTTIQQFPSHILQEGTVFML